MLKMQFFLAPACDTALKLLTLAPACDTTLGFSRATGAVGAVGAKRARETCNLCLGGFLECPIVQKYIQIYTSISKTYQDIPRYTKYQAAAGRPRRRLVSCIS